MYAKCELCGDWAISTFLIIHSIPECDRRADSHRPFVSGVSPDVTPASCSPRDTIPKQWVKPYNTFVGMLHVQSQNADTV